MSEPDELDHLWSDPANWAQGVFYRCATDPRLMVPKRVGIGYTINIAHQRAWFLFIGLLVVLTAPAIVKVALGSDAPGWLLPVTLVWPPIGAAITLVWLSRRDNS